MSTLSVPSTKTSPRDDATQLNRAFKGLGCDTAAVLNILAHRDASHRDDIQQEYETLFSANLKKKLCSELHGNLKKAVLLWMKSPTERDVKSLRQALTGPVVDAKAVTVIICSRSSSQIRQIQQAYSSSFDARLEHDIGAKMSGAHKKLLLTYARVTRYEGPEIDRVLVENDAKAINNGVREVKSGTDEDIFIDIFTERSRAHLVAVDATYKDMYGKDLETVVKESTSGNFKYGLSTILRFAKNPTQLYAQLLHKAMEGMGTDDSELIRIIVSRAEFDMQDIKREYSKMYQKALTDAVSSETSGHYRTFLLSILGSKN